METRSLKMHNKLLLDVIKRQAGTFDKAILELVMNAIEAGSPEVHLKFEENNGSARLICKDTGKGIQNECEIVHFFETFGTPHSASEGKVWAQFRMGRGQAFSFGKNTWRTTTFEMVVDIDKMGLDYGLRRNLPFVEGCEIIIDLYDTPVGCGRQYSSLRNLVDNIRKQIEFMDVPVYFNGEKLNHSPEDLNWTHEDNNAYYNFGVGQALAVYNLGAYVKSIDAATAGTVGVIVSKKQLKVNFARNDIQHDCPVWKEINNIVVANRIKKTRERKNESRRFDRYERIAALRDLRDGVQSFDDLKTLSLIETSSGKSISLDFIRKNRQKWSFAPKDDIHADKLMQADQALCISEEVHKELGYNGSLYNFFNWLTDGIIDIASLYVDFRNLKGSFSNTYTILPHDKLTKIERRFIKVMEGFGCWENRRICIGLSDSALAWTDGHSYIVFNRDWLSKNSLKSDWFLAELLATGCHELAHDIDTAGSHCHGETFYHRYHEITCNYRTPLGYICQFQRAMIQARAHEYSEQVIKRQQKAEAKRNKAIYGAAKRTTAAAAALVEDAAPVEIAALDKESLIAALDIDCENTVPPSPVVIEKIPSVKVRRPRWAD